MRQTNRPAMGSINLFMVNNFDKPTDAAFLLHLVDNETHPDAVICSFT
jgi:hypothetical protein